MHSKQQFCNSLSRTTSRAETARLVIAIVIALTVVLTQSVQAQTYKVIYNFTGGRDGASPNSLTMGKTGNFYGSAHGGDYGLGTVFEISQQSSGWVLQFLYEFTGYPNDGADPSAGVTIGPDGSLYGTTT